MRVLIGQDGTLEEVYRPPRDPWLRVNFVSTLDGAAAGRDGLSKSITNAADKKVFDTLRSMADVLVVGAGTLRAEGYDVPKLPLVVVSRSGDVPTSLAGAPPGRIMLATCEQAAGLAQAKEQLGEENVLTLGGHRVSLEALKAELVSRGFRQILCEGGPHLFRDLLDEAVADELCLTWVPRITSGHGPRITDGAPVDVPARLETLVEIDGTLLARWLLTG